MIELPCRGREARWEEEEEESEEVKFQDNCNFSSPILTKKEESEEGAPEAKFQDNCDTQLPLHLLCIFCRNNYDKLEVQGPAGPQLLGGGLFISSFAPSGAPAVSHGRTDNRTLRLGC